MTVPFTLLKPPRTVEIARCFTENCAAVCIGSICQVVEAAEAGSVINAARPVASAKRAREWPMFVSPLISVLFLFCDWKSDCFSNSPLHEQDFARADGSFSRT